SALADMARYYPQSAGSLTQMQGVGAAKQARYGDAFLAVIRAYCAERDIAERPKVGAMTRAAGPAVPGKTRRDEVLALYQSGRGVAEIGGIFGIKLATVANHLWEAVQDGVSIDPTPLLADTGLSAADQARALQAFRELGAEKLRPVYDALGETISFDALHLLRLYAVCTALQRATG
ncbi:MAG TPA: helix-turn-helix domain-containing protein, partial [Promineifilum sp.]|nr:helix-turn-helix domain-containing protein [Promineifilum sp.]